MRQVGLFLTGVFLVSLAGGVSFAEGDFSRISGVDTNLYSIAVSPFNPDFVYAGSDSAVFIKRSSGENFRRVFTVKGENKIVNDILFDSYQYQKAFFATGSGLYVSDDSGESFSKVFNRYGEEDSYVKCLAVDKYKTKIYLGTDSGLYSGEEGVYNFSRVSGVSADSTVYDMDISSEGDIAVACSEGVYIGRAEDRNFKRTLVSHPAGDGNAGNIPRGVKFGKENKEVIYLGTTSGLFVSIDNGESWDKISIGQFSGLTIRGIEAGKEEYYLATDDGLYRYYYRKAEVEKVFQGISTQNVRDIARSKEGFLWAATGSGLYSSYKESSEKFNQVADIQKYFRFEPSYMQVQEKAMWFNDVHPEKISKWRKALKHRALFPELDVGVGKYERDKFEEDEDRVIRDSEKLDWDVSLSWDIGDLVWNSYQDDIDTKSRLNTQTRVNILDELRRLFYERRKVKIKLIEDPPENQVKLIEKKLYLQELTSALDGYTGGYFSRKCREMRNAAEK